MQNHKQHENWKNTFIEKCLTCDHCNKSFKNYITFKEHIKNLHKKNELADDKYPFLVTKSVKQESLKVKQRRKTKIISRNV